MSVLRMKYGSAFSPVNTTKSNSSHPFSIKSLLNLTEDNHRTQTEPETRDLFSIQSQGFIESPSTSIPLGAGNFDLSRTEDFAIASAPLCPPWVFATRYSRFGIPAANYGNPRRHRKPSKKPKQRPLFSQSQLKQLEEEFVNEKYISKSRRMKLANEINLTEAQVRTWFQNRRTRWRKEIHGDKGSPCCEGSRWNSECAPQELAVRDCTPKNFVVVRGYCLS